jgi:ArsR family transcriptional regulator
MVAYSREGRVKRTRRPPEFYERKARTVAALAHPVRLAILDELSEGERSTGDLVHALGLHQPLVSQHLAVLRQAGVVERRREGNRRFYRLANSKIARACGLMSDVLITIADAERERLTGLSPVAPAR